MMKSLRSKSPSPYPWPLLYKVSVHTVPPAHRRHPALLPDPAAVADLRVLRAGGLGAGPHPHGPARPRAGGHQQRRLHLRIQVIRRPHRHPRPWAAARQAGWIFTWIPMVAPRKQNCMNKMVI